MYRILIILSALCATLELRAQGCIDGILQQIEDNNPTLSALRKATEATKIGNHTGLALEDPEVDFAYLWGSPRSVGNRKNIEVSQSFDMATLTGAKRRMAKEQDAMADYQYKLDRQEILLNARQLCIDIIYYNAMHNNLATRLEYAEQNAKSQKQRLDKGEGTQEAMEAYIEAHPTGEYINDENLSGFSVGMTIPLWSNKNKVKQAKAEAVAAKAKVADAKLQFYYNLQSLYQRQVGLHEVAEAYNQTVNTSNNMPLLKKALNKGAISVTAYITDLRTYYELKAQHLDATRSWHKAVAELLAITM